MRLTIVLIVILLTVDSFAAITFDVNGKWETTFDCVEQVQTDASWGDGSCDEVGSGVGGSFAKVDLTDGTTNLWSRSVTNTNEWYYTGQDLPDVPGTVFVDFTIFESGTVGALAVGRFGYGDNDSLGYDTVYIRQATATSDPDDGGSGYVHFFDGHTTYQSGDYISSITTGANNINGSGGRGNRIVTGGGTNTGTASLAVEFAAPQPELWLRWYMRYEAGYNWQVRDAGTGPYPSYDKHFFLNTQGTPDAIPEYKGREYAISSQGTVDSGSLITSGELGWPTIMGIVTDADVGAGRDAKLLAGGDSDGDWHCFEVHLKMDTTGLDGVGNNGVGQMWIDGELILDSDTQDFSGSVNQATVREGWINCLLGSIQGLVEGKGILSVFDVDIDDIVIYNQTPPNTDADGNPYIGPIGEEPTPTPAENINAHNVTFQNVRLN